MRLLTILFIFLLLFLPACNTINSLDQKSNELSSQIGQQEDFRVNEASGAVHATKKILDESTESDIYTESAKKTIDVATKGLPTLSIEDQQKWENIANQLIQDPQKGDFSLQKEINELKKSENEQSDLKKKLAETESRRLDLYERMGEKLRQEVEEAKAQAELQKTLIKIFGYAAVACVLIGAVGTYFLGFKVGANAFIAGAGFGLAAYYVSQTWFAYIGAGIAIITLCGIIYYLWGESRPKKVLKTTVQKIEKLGESGDARRRDAAKIVKDEVGNTFISSKEEKIHRDYVRKVKNT